MSLNKFSNINEKKEWMNINCKEIQCETFDAQTLNIEELDAQKIRLEGEPRQLEIFNGNVSQSANMQFQSESCQINFKNLAGQIVGSLVSSQASNLVSLRSGSVRDGLELDSARIDVNGELHCKEHLNLTKQSSGQAPAGQVSFYASNVSNNLVSRDNNNINRHVVTTQWFQNNFQYLPALTTGVYKSVLDEVQAGLGSKVIYADSQIDQGYEINFGGRLDITTGTSLRFALFIDGVKQSESDFVGVVAQTNESFEGKITIYGKDAGGGNVTLSAYGAVNFSNISAPRIAGLPLAEVITVSPPVNHTVDVKMEWAPSAVGSDEIETYSASIKKIY